MKYYKLLTQEMTSHANTKWEIGTPITIAKQGIEMCSNQVLHCYNHPALAVIFNPVHADIFNPKLFEISVDKIVATDGLKFASKSQTLIKEISLPKITLEEKIEFAIKVAKLFYKDESWNSWADAWLSREDCSKNSASAAARAAFAAAHIAWIAWIAACEPLATCALWQLHGAARAAARAAGDTRLAVYNVAGSACHAANYTDDKNEFNKKMIDIIEEIVKV